MNSESPASECFVYITLPGQTRAVTAGRFELTKDRRGIARGRFVYGRSYLARKDAVAIDPFELKLIGHRLQVELQRCERVILHGAL